KPLLRLFANYQLPSTKYLAPIMPESLKLRIPTVAIVGRPNVGKSTLFNRLIGSRRSIVGDEPGITRDRIYGEANWNGRQIRVVDTGGIVPDDRDLIPTEIYAQAKVALEEADAIIMVVDGRSHLTSTDMELARILLRGGKPLMLAVNKIDSPKQQADAEEFRKMGIRNVYFITAEHGTNVAELLEAALRVMPEKPSTTEDTEEDEGENEELTLTSENADGRGSADGNIGERAAAEKSGNDA